MVSARRIGPAAGCLPVFLRRVMDKFYAPKGDSGPFWDVIIAWATLFGGISAALSAAWQVPATFQVQCAVNQTVQLSYVNSFCATSLPDWAFFGILSLQTVVLSIPLVVYDSVRGRMVSYTANMIAQWLYESSGEKKERLRIAIRHQCSYANKTKSFLPYHLPGQYAGRCGTVALFATGFLVWSCIFFFKNPNLSRLHWQCNAVQVPFDNITTIVHCTHPTGRLNAAIFYTNIAALVVIIFFCGWAVYGLIALHMFTEQPTGAKPQEKQDLSGKSNGIMFPIEGNPQTPQAAVEGKSNEKSAKGKSPERDADRVAAAQALQSAALALDAVAQKYLEKPPVAIQDPSEESMCTPSYNITFVIFWAFSSRGSSFSAMKHLTSQLLETSRKKEV